MAYEFKFPDVGEGITEGEIVAWKVSEGESIVEDQTLVEMETDKAVVELPSPKAGKIVRLHGAEGDIVQVGSVLVTIEDSAVQPAAEVPAVPAAVAAALPSGPAAEAEPEAKATAEEPYTGSVVGRLEEAPEEEPATATKAVPSPKTGAEILALPSVRALAKELGVDLAAIRGTGTGGRILKQDVEDVAQAAAYGVVAAAASASHVAAGTRPETSASEPAGVASRTFLPKSEPRSTAE